MSVPFLLCEAKCLIMIIIFFDVFYVTSASSWPLSTSLSRVCLHTQEVWMLYPVSVALFMWCRSRNLPAGTLSFTPSSWGYCICFRTHIPCVRGSFYISAQDAQVYCLAGWPLSCNVAIELYIYIWSSSSIRLLYHRFLLVSVSCSSAYSHFVLHSFTNRLLIHIRISTQTHYITQSADCFSIYSCSQSWIRRWIWINLLGDFKCNFLWCLQRKTLADKILFFPPGRSSLLQDLE